MKLADAGQPKSAIVYNEQNIFAAAELQRYIATMSGATLPFTTRPPKGGPVISIGRTPWLTEAGVETDSLPDQGFMVKTVPKGLVLCGADKFSTLYSVYWFLENELGCGWCMPGEPGEVVPARATVEIGSLDLCRQPSLGVRSIYTFAAPGRPASDAEAMVDWSAKLGFNVAKIPRLDFYENVRDLIIREARQKRGMQIGVGVHTFQNFLPDDPYLSEHPEYFALVDGKRGGEHKHRICPSSMEAAEACAQNMNAYLDQHPEIDVIGLGAKDGAGGWCECPDCWSKTGFRLSALKPRVYACRVTTDAYIPFFNKVAEHVAAKHPNVKLAALFYTATLEPPAAPEARLHPNIDAAIALYARYYDRPLNRPMAVPEDYKRLNPDRLDEATYTYYPTLLRRWREVTQARVYFHAYFMGHGATSGLLFPIHDVIARDLEFYHEIGLDGFYTQGNFLNTAAYGLNFYMAAHKAMDVEADPAEILRGYIAKFYSTAEEPMTAYFDRLAKAKANGSLSCDPIHVVGLFDRDTLKSCKALLDRAARQCTNDGAQRRIAVQQQVFQYFCLYRDWILTCFRVRHLLADGTAGPTLDGALTAAGDKRKALRNFIAIHMNRSAVVPFTDMDRVDQRLDGVYRVIMSMKLAHQPAGFDEPWDAE